MKNSSRFICFLSVLVFLTGVHLCAQKSDAEKDRLQILNEANDTVKIKLLIKYGIKYYQYGVLDSCLKVAYDLSRVHNYRYGLAFGQYYEGLQLVKKGEYDKAIDKYKRSIDELDSLHVIQFLRGYPLAEIRVLYGLSGKQEERFRYYREKLAYYNKYGPIENTANSLHGIAGYYDYTSDYDKAIEYYIRAGEVYKSFDPIGYENEQQVIGSVYLLWGNFSKAEEYLKSALPELIRLNEAFYCYHQLGNLYFARHDYKQALQYYIDGKKYATFPEFKAINLVNCAAVYIQLNSFDSAKLCLDRAENIRQKEQLGLVYTHGDVEIDYYYYEYYNQTGKDILALQSLKSALKAAKFEKFYPLVLKYTNELHSYLLQMGDSLQAFRYLMQYQAIQDSLIILNTKARISSFEIEQQQHQNEDEIVKLQTQKEIQRNYYIIGGVILLLSGLALISRLRYKRKRDKEQLTTEFKKQLAQAETKALRAQMNPHFIFNSLNSINSFVIDQKHELASDYLIKFSKLIRLILDNSRSETITLEKELETLKLYVTLESARFDNKFTCFYNVAGDVNTNAIMIPPMLLQPFVENAIWHGLMQKEGQGTITIEISMMNKDYLKISIADDGIGREKAAALKSKSATHKSHGLKVTSQRIDMMNKLNSTGAQVHILDLKDEHDNATGTKVELIIPL